MKSTSDDNQKEITIKAVYFDLISKNVLFLFFNSIKLIK